ncbi:hypothetical protein PSTT_01261 [Puccinia striiformis]|uniref:Uncharacterized protein n=1 Tax=Puccinia striiformis TaxID=27350 RepID=A0A2S4W404_9BASI|nr:hypothetical protein PSTT_01261 [Puccinia striiformis]
MGILARFSSRFSEAQSPRPSPSQVTPPSLHHHLQSPTRLASSIDFQELLAAEPARTSPLSARDGNGHLKVTSMIPNPLLKWKKRQRQSSTTASSPAARASNRTERPSLPPVASQTQSACQQPSYEKPDQILNSPYSYSRPQSSKTGRLLSASPSPPSRVSSLGAMKQRGYSQVSSSNSPLQNRNLDPNKFNLSHSLSRHPNQNPVIDVDFSVFASNLESRISRKPDRDHQQLHSSGSTVDLIDFYLGGDEHTPSSSARHSRASRDRKHSLPGP